jgi:hypothetical protein
MGTSKQCMTMNVNQYSVTYVWVLILSSVQHWAWHGLWVSISDPFPLEKQDVIVLQ